MIGGRTGEVPTDSEHSAKHITKKLIPRSGCRSLNEAKIALREIGNIWPLSITIRTAKERARDVNAPRNRPCQSRFRRIKMPIMYYISRTCWD
jgi:hypothetical protein